MPLDFTVAPQGHYPQPSIELPIKKAGTFARLVFLNREKLTAEYHRLLTRILDEDYENDSEYHAIREAALQLRAAAGVLIQLCECFGAEECAGSKPRQPPPRPRKPPGRKRR